MKKYLRYAASVALLSGTAAALLRLWLILIGTDERGLYPHNHPSWVLCCGLSVLAVAVLWLMTREPGTRSSYRANFPASEFGAVGCIAAAAGFTVTGLDIWVSGAEPLSKVTGLLGVLSGAGMLVAAMARRTGKRPNFLVHMLPAMFFAVRAFHMGKVLGSEPEVCRYLFALLADLAAIPACYQLWGFDVGLGNRQKSLFWSLTAACLSIASIPGSSYWLLDVTVAAWLLTNLCRLKYLPERQPATGAEPAQAAPAAEEKTEEIPEQASPAEPAETAAIPDLTETAEGPVAELEPEEVLEDILREIDKIIE